MVSLIPRAVLNRELQNIAQLRTLVRSGGATRFTAGQPEMWEGFLTAIVGGPRISFSLVHDEVRDGDMLGRVIFAHASREPVGVRITSWLGDSFSAVVGPFRLPVTGAYVSARINAERLRNKLRGRCEIVDASGSLQSLGSFSAVRIRLPR